MAKFHVSMMDNLLERILQRDGNSNRSLAIAQLCERHLDLIDDTKRTLSERFDDKECGLIIDALNGVYLSDRMSVRLLPQSIVDSYHFDNLQEKWGVDDSFIERVNGLNLTESYAIADAVTVWWRNKNQSSKDYGDLFKVPKQAKK